MYKYSSRTSSPDDLLPITFPSWSGLGVGSYYLLPITYYLLPITLVQMFCISDMLPVPCSLFPVYI
ncbi:hypothetical protein [Moorena producens]|uniref:hypothetical protein n=1 Tax=Moorena producens TaxID=1155739 RepID=UPI000AADE6C5|nr:hypothetical protein [Moorena producens]